METAAKLLRYTNKEISDIVYYFRFPSQSHCGKVFKDEMGLTPKQYRDREGVQDTGV